MGPDTPANLTFGGGSNATVLHPLMLAAMIVALLVMLFAPRKYMPVAFFLLVFLGALGQQIFLFGFHFYLTRILVMAALVRIVASKILSPGPLLAGGVNIIDKLFIAWILCHCVANALLNNLISGAIIYQVSFLIDVLGGYLLMRFAIRDEEDIIRTIKVFAALTCILAVTMGDEKFHNQNIFGYLGSLPIIPGVREGAIRATGAFAHPILAGVFGVCVMPLFMWLWKSGKAKIAGVFGLLGSIGMILMSASSTPLMGFLAALIFWYAWPYRNQMHILRWGIVLMLIALHMVMKAPVWMLIARVDVIAGNSGYHRAMLVDQCIRHFSDWWLVGTNAAGTWGWDLWDTSNQFVQEAENAGLLTFILFIAVISASFRRITKARHLVEDDPQKERYMWCLTVTLLTNCICFFGITYFDHTRMMWFAVLAIVSAATAPILATAGADESVTATYGLPHKRELPSKLEATKPSRDKTLQPVNRMRLS